MRNAMIATLFFAGDYLVGVHSSLRSGASVSGMEIDQEQSHSRATQIHHPRPQTRAIKKKIPKV